MTSRWITAATAAGLLACVVPARGQSVLERTPNIGGTWWGASGSVYFNFLHRFTHSDAPARQVTNYPSFLLAAGLPYGVLAGFNYATRSDVAPGLPNEWEFFARHAFLRQYEGAPLDVVVHAGYNQAAESFDSELTLGRSFGKLKLLGVVRAMTNGYASDTARFAVGGGATLQLTPRLALAGDAVTLLDAGVAEDLAWSAGLQIAIPGTPHTLSLQVANTNTSTVQGSSRGADTRRYGFEFTVPITLRRYFGGGNEPVAAPLEPPGDSMAVIVAVVEPVRPAVRDSMVVVRPDSSPTAPVRVDTVARGSASASAEKRAAPPPRSVIVNARIRNLVFEPGQLRVSAGTTIVWRNGDQVEHTIKAADGSWESPAIKPGATWRRTFAQPGRYAITCGPHPFMKLVVEVR